MRRRRSEPIARASACALAIALALIAPRGAADDAPDTARARDEFVHGTDFVRRAQWAEALAAFERSAKIRPHAVTTYNVGACERALGRYTRARATFLAALAQNDAAGGQELAEGLVGDTRAYLAQIDALLATVDVSLAPESAAIAVDGRPLAVTAQGDPPTLAAGVREAGPGEPPPGARFTLVADPGAHVITLSRKGYADAVLNKTLAPGSRTQLAIVMDKLPATFHIAAEQPNAIVKFDGSDVGAAPVDVSRPGGTYRVMVTKPGFVTYETTVTGQPGEEVNLRARLPEEKPSILGRWWFWAAAATVVAGAATATYFVTRSDATPQRPPVNGGGLGWSVPVP